MASFTSKDETATIITGEYDLEKTADSKLPLIDGGRKAWAFLAGAFMIEGLLYGFPLFFGIFQEYLRHHTSYGNDPFLTNVGTISIGIAKLLAPVMTPIIIRYQAYRRQLLWAGWAICLLSLVLASFSTQLWHIVAFQGFLFGIGWMVIYYPMLNLMNEWWIIRRGFAYGVLFGSEGLFGFGIPFLLEFSLKNYGFAWTLRAYAIAVFILIGPVLPFLNARNPIDPYASKSVKMERGVFSKVAFTAMSFSNIFQGLVVYLPTLFFPVFAAAINLSTSQGTLILAITNIAIIIGMVGLGYLADKMDSLILAGAASTLASLSVFLLWGYSTTFTILLMFSIAYGMFASAYSVLYSRFSSFLSSETGTQTWLYSAFECQRGTLIILGGLMGGTLVGNGGEVREAAYGAGKYQSTVVVVGASLALSAIGGLGYFLRNLRWRVKFQLKIVDIDADLLRIQREVMEEQERREWEMGRSEKAFRLPELELEYYELKRKYVDEFGF